MKKKMKYLGLLILFVVILSGCGNKDEKKEDKKDEPKELTMYIGVVEEQALKIAQEFEKDTGIKVNFVRMSGGEILSRIRAEKDAPKASIWYGGPSDSFVAAKKENLLQPYISGNAKIIPENMKDKEGYWTGIYNEILGFVLDDRWFTEKNIAKPKTWDDLLKPEYKGQITVANPGASGTAFLFLSGFVQQRGEDKGLEYLAKLNENVKQYTKSGTAPAKSVILGESAIGITFIHNGLRYKEEGYDNVSVVVPEDGTWYSTAAVGIIAGAPELEAAKKFVDWALTKNAQEIGQKFKSYQFPTNPEANIPDIVKPYQNFKMNEYNLEWSGEHRAELVEKWDKMLKSK
ncbi:ABC transporter substrate-binding protein [Pseudoleptotrichia goodfellowii]|uniref:ABC transporter, solute-binding protein n=1 Tax=Pseudoleptotrichia goodfellowii F0264 TaxID=596323 RepID=D0GPL6_9FUSO|nr:ABC transporter substrate-binding protein [Pseudoleptotrichia goodfellowii]EEY33969.1 ABC transporter, solute-binding protein [Pseudoleptotrichia goodfellowii F0264]MBF4805088.1 ABC transporter substrate-binding protein [Pseudoleptotrichia goodfellowii]